jgi:hypothetical protein
MQTGKVLASGDEIRAGRPGPMKHRTAKEPGWRWGCQKAKIKICGCGGDKRKAV